MDFIKVRRTFKVVGIKGRGKFDLFGREVPNLAQQFLLRLDEIDSSFGNEIALFEPKRNDNHLEGYFFVGVMVNESLTKIPIGMEYIELSQTYASVKGKINNIGILHSKLVNWLSEQEYERDLESLIIETYHPMENGEEEVEIYLPIYN